MPHPEGPFRQVPFDHRQHVRFAWHAIREVGPHDAERLVADEIRSFAAERAPGKFHLSMTSFWVRLVAHTIAVSPSTGFDDHVARFPVLLDKGAPSRHYSRGVMASDVARIDVVEPDLLPFP